MTSRKNTLRIGVLGAAKIAVEKVIPAIKKASGVDAYAIASRDFTRAVATARKLDIPNVFKSYEELLSDEYVDAVYIPLPNHLHVEWTEKAARQGKHVLCEKPLSLDAAGVQLLNGVAGETGVTIEEAFMVRTHPVWIKARKIVDAGELGSLKAVNSFFSYFNDDASNIRNKPEAGGGAMLDIGCYPVNVSRWLFGREPVRVSALLEVDRRFGTDVISTAIMDFEGCHSSFTCSTQLVPYQRVDLIGTERRLEVFIPFNIPRTDESLIRIYDGDRFERKVEEIRFDPVDQYVTMCESFCKTVKDGASPSMSLADSLSNSKVLDAIFRAGKSGKWEPVSPGI